MDDKILNWPYLSPAKLNGHYKRADGSEFWYKESKLHRFDGPAAIKSNRGEWWFFEGEGLTKEEVELAKTMKLRDAPLYIDHPKLKYLAEKLLKE